MLPVGLKLGKIMRADRRLAAVALWHLPRVSFRAAPTDATMNISMRQ